jgi:hypothetical protein
VLRDTATLQGSGCHIGGACIRSRIRIRDGFGGIGLDSRAPAGVACIGQRRRLNGKSGSHVNLTTSTVKYIGAVSKFKLRKAFT